MNVLSMILSGVSLVPGVVQSVEGLFGSKSGADKKQAAITAVGSAINLTDAVSSKQVVNADQFQSGLGQVIDGIVACLNASIWAKKK
jgi:hypothetical protein